MPLTVCRFFKLLPNTNCKKCGYPTCLTFAMKGWRRERKRWRNARTRRQRPRRRWAAAFGRRRIRGVTIGRGERAVTVGEETVFFRHEKTFVRKPGLFQTFGSRRTHRRRTRMRAWTTGGPFASNARERRFKWTASPWWKRPEGRRPRWHAAVAAAVAAS